MPTEHSRPRFEPKCSVRLYLTVAYLEFSLKSLVEPLNSLKHSRLKQLDLYFKKIILTADWRMTGGRGRSKRECKEDH